MERGQQYRNPPGDDKVNYETDEVLPRLSTLFGISNQEIRVILLKIGTVKAFGNGYQLGMIGVDSFKSYNIFDKKIFRSYSFHFKQSKKI